MAEDWNPHRVPISRVTGIKRPVGWNNRQRAWLTGPPVPPRTCAEGPGKQHVSVEHLDRLPALTNFVRWLELGEPLRGGHDCSCHDRGPQAAAAGCSAS